MATRPVPELIVGGVAEHLRAGHGIEAFEAGQVGVPSSRSARCLASWDRKGPAGGAWFHCRLCPPGFNRYTAELGLPEPTPRIAELIRLHLELHRAACDGPEPEASSYRAASARAGASITCSVCREGGRDPVLLTDPPFGDARRLRHLLASDRALAARVAAMSPIEQALALEAEDRRRLAREELGVPRPALRRANRVAPSSATACVDGAALRLLRAETADGRGITTVIAELDRLALADPAAFGCRLAVHLDDPPERLPVVRQTGLWRVWKTRDATP